jgi:Zinc carboxypeptidase
MRFTREGVALLKLAIEVSAEELERAREALTGVLSYEHVEVVAARLVAGSRSVEIGISTRSAPIVGAPSPPRPGAAAKHDLDLSNLYTPEGLLGDSDQNLIADRLDAVLSPGGRHPATMELAARLGLEGAGISIPIVKLPSEIESPEDEPTLILVGEHPLLPVGTVALDEGVGSIRVIPRAFGEKPALAIQGGDEAGVARALDQLAVRFPHVWERGKDRTTLDDVERDLWNFFSGRSPAGQAATALYKLDRILAGLEGKDLRSAKVLVSVEKPDPGFEARVRDRAAGLGAEVLDVVVDDRDVQRARTLFEDEVEIPSEVDDFWRLFRSRVLPRAGGRQSIEIEVRLSESNEVRRNLEAQIREELERKGARNPVVRVLSAFKQGYSWLDEVVRPALEGRSVDEIVIRFARYRPPVEWPHQAMGTDVRWLHEAFPIDEVLARDLGIRRERVRFEMAPPEAPAYEVVAASGGAELLRQSFSPRVVLRPYIDRFRDYEMVNVTTGWVRALRGDEVLLDQRIATDAERFWDRFQGETLARIYDYVMALHEGEPRGAGKDAPYFGELEVEVELSEPHETIGIEREILSPMDALHEDVYFTTLMFFRLLGRNARGEELTYPGRVLPVMVPKSDGKSGRARTRFTGFAASRPAVIVEYEESNGARGKVRLDVPRVEMDRPRAMAATVRAGSPGLERLEVRIKVDTDRDEREELVRRAREEEVDDAILSSEQAVAAIEILNDLRARGLYRDALAYYGVGELAVVASWEHRPAQGQERSAILRAEGAPLPFPDVNQYLVEPVGPVRFVQWDRPMPPPEAYGVLARMARFPEATVYKAGESYLGKDVWAMDLMSPIEASHFSHQKATTLKPTILYTARQHANEVSSTSHVLKLAELLLTDPEERKKLDRVNVVIHPVTNPDGAQLAYDLYTRTPEFILHAGYLASLGMDVTSDEDQPLPLYPEAAVRPALWSTWLPDIVLNPHGYPSHQLVQLFSEYTGLVRRGRVTERNWSMNKGWFMPGFDYLDDPRFPRHKDAAFQIRDYITEAISSDPEIDAMNRRNYDRYYRYGGQFDEDDFKLPMVGGVLIHTALKGSRAPAPGSNRDFNPRVTIWSGTTEAPDETAEGEWLQLVSRAGLKWDQAILQYLLDGRHAVERKGSSFFRGVSLSLDRPRPPKPEEK